MLVVIWEYQVRPGQEAAFEALYGPQGGWVALFRAQAGYVDTQLLRAPDGHYVTLDRWDSAPAYDAFLAQAHDAYAHLDAAGDALTLSERRVGRFVAQGA